ncbi:MAG: hypothetical protein U9P49_11435, partial [Thermodesulfobacteriota bacterium]|nr:hypothetical protein [Thermodesulfobacteriota bacterium]
KQANIHHDSTTGSETTSQRLTTYIRIDVIKQNYMVLFYSKDNYLLNRFSLIAISGSKLADADRKRRYFTIPTGNPCPPCP